MNKHDDTDKEKRDERNHDGDTLSLSPRKKLFHTVFYAYENADMSLSKTASRKFKNANGNPFAFYLLSVVRYSVNSD